MDQQWIDLNILMDVGVQENTIKSLVVKLKALNDERPSAQVNHQKSANEVGAKLLKCIFECSKHFSEGATTEYNALPANWQFVHVAPHPLAGQRDVDAIEAHYHALWSAAVRSKLPGFHGALACQIRS